MIEIHEVLKNNANLKLFFDIDLLINGFTDMDNFDIYYCD